MIKIMWLSSSKHIEKIDMAVPVGGKEIHKNNDLRGALGVA